MKKKLISISLMITLLITLSLSVVNAETNVKMQITSSSELTAGGTVELILSITNIDAGDGIDAVVGKVNYDKNIFEEVTEENFEGQNRWNSPTFNTGTQLFTTSRASKVKTSGNVIKITLKVKEGVTADSTTVTITNIVVSGGSVATGGTGDINVSDVSAKINKKQEDNKPDENTVPDFNSIIDNTVTDNTINDNNVNNNNINDNKIVDNGDKNNNKPTNNNQNNGSKNTVKQNTESNKILPKAGVKQNIVIFTTILVIIGIFSYAKYRNISKNVK